MNVFVILELLEIGVECMVFNDLGKNISVFFLELVNLIIFIFDFNIIIGFSIFIVSFYIRVNSIFIERKLLELES